MEVLILNYSKLPRIRDGSHLLLRLIDQQIGLAQADDGLFVGAVGGGRPGGVVLDGLLQAEILGKLFDALHDSMYPGQGGENPQHGVVEVVHFIAVHAAAFAHTVAFAAFQQERSDPSRTGSVWIRAGHHRE